MKATFTVLLLFSLFYANAQSNENNPWSKKLEHFQLKPIVGLQLWNTYTTGAEVYHSETKEYQAVDNRLNTHIRRTRLGVKGQAYTNLQFNITVALDLIGRDLLAGTQGGANNGSTPSLGLWNAFLQWKILKNKEWLNISMGYLVPQIGRESITAALRTTSMEKSWSQNYLRRQLVGTGPGRAAGINWGGLFYQASKKIGFSYDFGIFNPVFTSLNGNSTGQQFTPLWVGRAVLYLGEPESRKYSISHKINYFGQRKGLSLGVAAARQGPTELFKSHYVFSIDWLFNWANWNIDGEWSFLQKTKEFIEEDRLILQYVQSNTGYIRFSYNWSLTNDRLLEPVFMMMQFNGALSQDKQELATAVDAFAGKDYSYYIGMNYYLNADLKLSLGYTWRYGEVGALTQEPIINNYFFQSGVGAIHRGNWLGLGVVFIL